MLSASARPRPRTTLLPCTSLFRSRLPSKDIEREHRPPDPLVPEPGQVLVHRPRGERQGPPGGHLRSEEHTSELQSRGHLVCRLLLQKNKDEACFNLSQHISEYQAR